MNFTKDELWLSDTTVAFHVRAISWEAHLPSFISTRPFQLAVP